MHFSSLSYLQVCPVVQGNLVNHGNPGMTSHHNMSTSSVCDLKGLMPYTHLSACRHVTYSYHITLDPCRTLWPDAALASHKTWTARQARGAAPSSWTSVALLALSTTKTLSTHAYLTMRALSTSNLLVQMYVN